jgi:N-acetylglucosaminyl-diphospho-decaprenol L-rhamnosyltransferase
MDSAPDLSVVIVSYQVRGLLERCLASLGNYRSPLSLEVLVVDNASPDGSAEMVRDCFPAVHLVANAENRGFSAANNQALRQARGRYVMLLNPDAEVEPGALDALVRFMDSHPRAGACGPKLVYGDGSLQYSAFMFPSLAQIYFDLFPANWRLLESRLNGRYPRKLYSAARPFPIDHPLGAAFLVRRAVTEQVGLLDEDFFIYAEEIDWAWRIRRAGWEIWCVPGAEIVHHEAQSTRQFRDRMFVELWRARFHFFRKHYSHLFNGAAGLLVRAGMRRAASNARGALARGAITEAECRQRVAAFREVASLTAKDAEDAKES